jgi:hypothetical protein
MKLKNAFYVLALAVLGLFFITGCRKSEFDINKNPNAPTDSTITYNLILPAALQTTSTIVETNFGWLQNWLGYWARSGTYAPNVTEESYQITTNFQAGIWDNLYSNNFNYDIMQKKAHQAGATFYEGVARILKAHNFQLLVDLYNNIPYFQALKGSGNPTPAYDKGIDIYKDLFRQIDTAIVLLNDTDPDLNLDYKTNDLVYGGNTTKWIKFGNTLKLRLLVHLYKVPGFNFSEEIDKIDATGVGYLGTGETAQINPGFNATKPNPFYRSYVRDETATATGNSVYYKANEYAIGYYTWNGDPRISRFYTAGSLGQRGVAYGLPPSADNIASKLSAISGPGLLKNSGYDAPAWILTSVESLFLQAEARERGIIKTGPTAGVLLNAAIRESFIWLGLSAATANSYISNNETYPDVDYNAPGGGIVTIINQKWFALNAIAPFEIWTDYRRADYAGEKHFIYGEAGGFDPGPPISVAPQNTSREIPVRLLYPQNEYNYNAKNVGSEGTINQFTNKIFWDIE